MRIFDKIMNNYSVKTRIPFPYLMFTILGGIHFVEQVSIMHPLVV